MDTKLANPPHLADYIRPVWQRRWLVLFVVLVATSAGFARAVRQPKSYDAGTLVFYQQPGDPLAGGVGFVSDRTIADVAGLLYSLDTAGAVAQRIRFPGSPGRLVSLVTISARMGQDFVAISARAGNPAQAAAIANGYAQQLVTVTNGDQQRLLNQEMRALRQQLGRTSQRPEDISARQILTSQIGKLQLALTVPTGTRQVSPAVAPVAPTSPRPVRDAIFAFVLSLALAVAVAFGLERFDRRLKRPEDLEGGYGLPLLTVLPHTSDPAPRHNGVVGLGPGFHEAFGLLRTNIHLLSLDAEPRSIVIVSAIPGEGKSTVVRNLAIALAESGKRVAVVEADLRRPMQSGLFGLPTGPGLTEVLTGSAALSDVLHEVPTQARGIEMLTQMSTVGSPAASGNGGLVGVTAGAISVLLAGTHPPNPATVLESVRVVELLDELSATHDVVVLDSAPLLSVTDSVPLVRYADAAVIVGRLDLTTRDSVRRMTAFLKRMPDARVLGIVANDLADLGSSGYGYGYGYGGYGGGDAATHSRRFKKSKRGKRADRAKAAEQV